MDDVNPYASPMPADDDGAPHDAPIQCPVCGEAAEKGYLNSIGSIDWIPGEKKLFKWSSKGVERLTAPSFSIEGKLTGIRCRRCNRIVIEA